MADRRQELAAIALFMEVVRVVRSVDLVILNPDLLTGHAVKQDEVGEVVGVVFVPSPGFGVTGVLIPGPARKLSPPDWIAEALERKGRADHYGPAERARTTLLIDCSREIMIEVEDAAEFRSELEGNTLGFAEVWCVSANWAERKGLLVAP